MALVSAVVAVTSRSAPDTSGASRSDWGLVGVVVAGLQVHLVPMMTDRGLSNDDAGLLLVVLGLASLVGRVVGGFVIDRVHASIVGSIVMLAPIAGLFFLHPPFSSAAIAIAFIGAILIGTLGPYAYPAASEVLSDIAESTANPSATRERL